MVYEKITTFIMAMLPVGELRVSIPFALFRLDLNWPDALFYSFLGNATISFLLLYAIRYYKIVKIKNYFSNITIVKMLSKKGFNPFYLFNKWEKRSIKKSKSIKKWGYVGLICFVGLPLPVTGAWTAVLISTLLRLNTTKAFLSIVIGLSISGSIVTLLSIYSPQLLEYIFITINKN
jgi:uncharacterized membrane protein